MRAVKASRLASAKRRATEASRSASPWNGLPRCRSAACTNLKPAKLLSFEGSRGRLEHDAKRLDQDSRLASFGYSARCNSAARQQNAGGQRNAASRAGQPLLPLLETRPDQGA